MDRPHVLINMAMTVDGKITSARREYPRFTSPYDRQSMDRLRASSDGILVGAGTMRADNPTLHVRDAEIRKQRERERDRKRPVRVLVTASANIGSDSRFFDEQEDSVKIVATVDDAPPGNLAALDGKAEIWKVGRDRVDLAELLRRLKSRGVERLLVEGGGELNWGFVRLDLVDEIYVTIAPSLLGGRDAPTLLEGSGLAMPDQRRLRLESLHREGDELYCRYVVVRR